MYKGTNPSAIRSQKMISNSLIALMQKRPFEQISITKIMETSELARQTFYQVFDSKDEVLEYYLDGLLIEYLNRCKIETVNNLCDAAKLFFQFFHENESFVELLAQNEKNCILQKKCDEYLQDEHFLKFTESGIKNPLEKTFASSFITSGLVGMLINWIQNGKKMSIDELAKLVCRITGTDDD